MKTASDDWRAEHLPIDRGRKITKAERDERRAACLRAVREVHDREVAHRREHDTLRYYKGVSASMVARHLGVQGAARLGNGAVGGSWSGSMPEALRVAPTLRSLCKAGEIEGSDRNEDYRWYYWPPGEEPWTVWR